eukprot:5516847-Lingulodinium_polyedra.AAC.1
MHATSPQDAHTVIAITPIVILYATRRARHIGDHATKMITPSWNTQFNPAAASTFRLQPLRSA